MMVSSIFCFVLLLFISSGQITTTNYTYLTHGKDWNISVCLTGGQQSPIDIYNYDITKYSSLHYFFAKYHSSMSTSSYLNVSLTIESNDSNLGYGTLLTVLPDSIGSKKAFQAQNIIFRAPAEHVFNGSRYPLEVQVYHKLEKAFFTQYAVVSFFFNYSNSSNEFLNNIIVNNQSKKNSFEVDLTSLINFQNSDDFDYWAYQGSLSMPTCDENTNWYLMKKIFEANSTEIDYFVNLYHNNSGFSGDGNYRELQTGNRTIDIKVMDFQRN